MSYNVEKQFTYKGLKCVIIFIENNYGISVIRPDIFSYRCGYVGVLENNKYYEVEYNNIEDLNVYGGLTYSHNRNDYPIKTNYPIWWLGFDCRHDDDIINPKSLEFVIKECKKLANQIIKYNKKDK